MSFADLTLRAFLEQVSARQTAPGAGAVAASVTAAAAALAAMSARFAGGDTAQAAAEAAALRDRALELADADALAYAGVVEARRAAAGAGGDAAVAEALGHACDVPLEILAVACEVATLGARVYEDSTPDLRGDAATAVLLAAAAGHSAAALVDVNVRQGGLDGGRCARAASLAGALARAAGRVPLGWQHG